MNKKILATGVLFLLFLGIQGGLSDQTRRRKPIRKIDLPDLTAVIEFVKVKTFKNSKNITCYTITPKFIVKNIGKTAAKDFDVRIEWYTPPHFNWQIFSVQKNQNLGAGQSNSTCGSAYCNVSWCSNEKKKAKWRVTVDYNKEVGESNEINNEVEKAFIPPRRIIKINRSSR